MPSRSVVFFCFAVSNLDGSSASSGVDCLSNSTLPLATDNRSDDPSETSVFRRSLITLNRSPAMSAADLPVVVPQATRDFKTATKHSKPCLRSCCSDRPMFEVSKEPETLSVLVFSGGGRLLFCAFEVGPTDGLMGSACLGCVEAEGRVPSLEMIFMRLLKRSVETYSRKETAHCS
jgi:hypothetical protein